MASAKEYGYFIKGSKLALIEKDTALDNDVNSRDYGPDVTNVRFTSPQSTVADGIELEYIYSPKYLIESTDVSTTTVSGWDQDNDGNFRRRAAGGTDWTSSPNLSSVEWIVLRNAGRWNGLHKVSLVQSTRIVTTTKVSASTSNTDFEQTVTLYYDVNPLNDESDTLPISEYLSKAVVYYLKAKTAEDQGNFQLRDVMFKEFYRIVEKSDNAKIHTIRRVAPHSAAIR